MFGNFSSFMTPSPGQISVPENGLPFWVSGVLCQCSEVVLWNLLSVQMFFDEFVGEKVISPSYSSTILGLLSVFTFSSLSFCFVCFKTIVRCIHI